MELSQTKPYLIRAFYEWIVDNDLTPHVMVDANIAGVQVPLEFVVDGQIVLNISASAVKSLELGNEWIFFNARFGGIPQDIHVPIVAVKAIYAQENGKGMVFSDEDNVPPPSSPSPTEPKKASQKPTLRVVK